MNKTELVAAMAEKAGVTKKDTEAVLKAFMEVTTEELKAKGSIQLVGFATFSTKERAARENRNPQTGATKFTPAHSVPHVKFSQAVKDMVKNG